MKINLDIGHSGLTDWAEWVRSHENGFPKNTTIGRCMKSGTERTSTTVTTVIPNVWMNPRISKVNRAISDMPQIVRTAVFCCYYPELAMYEAKMETRHERHWTEADKTELFKMITKKGKTQYSTMVLIARGMAQAVIRAEK